MSIRGFGHRNLLREASWLLLIFLICLSGRCIGQTYNGFGYIASGANISITGYIGPGGAVTVPSSIPGVNGTVTSLTSYSKFGWFAPALTSLAIPGSVTNIEGRAFWWCSGLTAFAVAPENSFYSSIDGVLLDKGGTTLIQCPAGLAGAYTVPGSVTAIGGFAFDQCSGLTSVTLPSGVTSIGDSAFLYCSGLTSLNIPGSVTNIADSAFLGCASLTSITIPDSVTSIAHAAFADCSALTTVTLPSGVTSIGITAFSDCTGLTSVTIPGTVTNIGDYAFSWCTNLTSAYFQGNAPASFASSAFGYANSGFTIYYPSTASGWSTPGWNAYRAQPYNYVPPSQRPVLTLSSVSGAVTPSFSKLQVGTNYQLQVSADLKTWSNSGAAFAATNTSRAWTRPFPVTNANQLFFRLQPSP